MTTLDPTPDELHAFRWKPPAPPAFDAFASFQTRIDELDAEAPMSPRTKANLRRSLATIDPAARDAFLAEHEDRLQDIRTQGPAKYADFAYWAQRSTLVAEWLDLDTSPPLDILDIGMGSGSFAMVAQSMGHRVVGTDVVNPWYDELCRLAGVKRIVAPVGRGEAYQPPLEGRFDLITIMLPVFHRTRVIGGRPDYWSVEDWRALLRGLQRDLLKPEGSIFILMPLEQNEDGEQTYSPVVRWAESRGAILDRRPGVPISRIYFHPVLPDTFAP
jgi:methyltransferase family protein